MLKIEDVANIILECGFKPQINLQNPNTVMFWYEPTEEIFAVHLENDNTICVGKSDNNIDVGYYYSIKNLTKENIFNAINSRLNPTSFSQLLKQDYKEISFISENFSDLREIQDIIKKSGLKYMLLSYNGEEMIAIEYHKKLYGFCLWDEYKNKIFCGQFGKESENLVLNISYDFDTVNENIFKEFKEWLEAIPVFDIEEAIKHYN